MIKNLFFSFLISISICFASDTPPSEQKSLSLALNLRGFYNLSSKLNLMTELKYIKHENRGRKISLIFGGKYRAFRNLKLGAYIERAQGIRQDEDWIKKNGVWHWQNSTTRAEYSGILEVSPRFLLGPVVFATRVRFRHNFEFAKRDIHLRPEAIYTLVLEGKPFVLFSLSHEIYLPLNYGNKGIYGSWTYLGSLFILNKNIKLGPFIGLGSDFWTETEFHRSKGLSFESRDNEILLGFNFNFYL